MTPRRSCAAGARSDAGAAYHLGMVDTTYQCICDVYGPYGPYGTWNISLIYASVL